MIALDIPADLRNEDDAGFVWAFLDEAREPTVITPGALVISGDDGSPVVAIVIEHVPHPRGTVRHVMSQHVTEE